jgi:hypothetical protein
MEPGGSRWSKYEAERDVERHIGGQLRSDGGRKYFELDSFAQAFSGTPDGRIKFCDQCGRVYWVRRTDAQVHGCTVACSKILRTRKWREKVTEVQKLKYKRNRIKKETSKGE